MRYDFFEKMKKKVCLKKKDLFLEEDGKIVKNV